MVVALLLLILLHQVYAVWVARRERRAIMNAALSRTPAEFEALQSGQSG